MRLSEKQIIDALKYDPHLNAQYNAIMQILQDEIDNSVRASISPNLSPDDRSFNCGRSAGLEDLKAEILSIIDVDV